MYVEPTPAHKPSSQLSVAFKLHDLVGFIIALVAAIVCLLAPSSEKAIT